MNAQKTNNIQTLRDIEKQMANLNVPAWLWDEGRHKIVSANRDAVKFWNELSVFDLIDQLFGENHPLAEQFSIASKQLKSSIKPVDQMIDFNVVDIAENTNCNFSHIKTDDGRSYVMIKVMAAQKIETIQTNTEQKIVTPSDDMIGKMLDNAPVTLALFDEDGGFNYANEAARHLFADADNQFVEPSNLSQWLSNDADQEKITALIEKAKQYKIANDSLELSTSFGSRMHNIVAKSLSLGEGEDKAKYILTYIRDVADERDYEQLLMDRISRLETLTKIGSDFNFILDEELNFVQIGGNFETLTGFEPSEIVGRNWLEIAFKLGLDPDGIALDHFTTATSFDNLMVSWPVKGTEDKVHLSWRSRAIYEKENGEKRFVGNFVTAFENILAFDASDLEQDLALHGVSASDISVSDHIEVVEDDSLEDMPTDMIANVETVAELNESDDMVSEVAEIAEVKVVESPDTDGSSISDVAKIAAIGAAATTGAVLLSDEVETEVDVAEKIEASEQVELAEVENVPSAEVAEVETATAEDTVAAVEVEVAAPTALEKAYMTNARQMIADANILPTAEVEETVSEEVEAEKAEEEEAPKGEAIMSYLGDASNLSDESEVEAEISELAEQQVEAINIDENKAEILATDVEPVEDQSLIDQVSERVEEKTQEITNFKDAIIATAAAKVAESEAIAAEKTSEIAQIVDEKQVEVSNKVAEVKAEAAKLVAEIQAETEDKVAEIKNAASEKVEALTSEVEAKVSEVKSEVDEKVEAVKQAGEETMQAASEKAEEVKSSVEAKVSEVKSEVEEKVDAVKQASEETLQAASEKVDALKSDAEAKIEEVKQAGKDAIDAANEKVEEAKQVAEAQIEKAKETIAEKTDDIESAIDQKVAEASNKIETIKSDVKETTDQIGEKLDQVEEDLEAKVTNLVPSDHDQEEKEAGKKLGLKKILGGAGVASVIGAFVGKKSDKKDNIFKASNDDDKLETKAVEAKEEITEVTTEAPTEEKAETEAPKIDLAEKVEAANAELMEKATIVETKVEEVAEQAAEVVEAAKDEIETKSVEVEAVNVEKIEALEATIADKMEKIEVDLDDEDQSIQSLIEKADLNEEEADHFAALAQKINASVDDADETVEDFASEADEADDEQEMLADNVIAAFGAKKSDVEQMGKSDVDMFKTVLDQTPVIALLSRIPMSDEANILFANKQAKQAFNIQEDSEAYLNELTLNLSEEVEASMFEGINAPLDQNVVIRFKDQIMNYNAKINKVTWRNDDALQYILVPMASNEQKIEKAKIDEAAQIAKMEEIEASDDELNQDVAQFILDGQAFIDDNYTILFANKHLSRMVNKRTDELVGMPIDQLIKREHVNIFQDYAISILSDDQKNLSLDGVEIDLISEHGDPVSIFLYISKLEDDLAKDFASNILVNMRDISKWKRKEANLREAKERAEQDNIQKSGFLARISHELRTPLNAIIGFSEVMSDEKFGPLDNSRYKGYATDINESGEHLLSLINDLLDLSKIEAGSVELNFKAVDLEPIISQSVSLMQAMADKKRIVIRTSIASNIPQIIADTRSIRQIILNLLSNSIKYSNPGSQVIISALLDDDGEVIIRVRDTGVGMNSEQLKTAMEPFKTVDMATIVDKNGTGLGLPLTKALAEANRAEFNIESATDAGTLVQITFPTTRVLTQ